MADNDVLLIDSTTPTPVSFAPESTDQGTNAGGKPVRRSMFGMKDGAHSTSGALADAALTTWTTAGTFMGAFRGLWRDVAKDGTDATAATQLAGGAGIRGWLSGIFIQALALATGLGTQADAAAASSTANASIFGWLKRYSANDDTALQAISTASTREGSLSTSTPDAFANSGSGKLGALEFVWKYTKAAAASLISLVGLASNTLFGVTLSANGVLTMPVGPNGTNGFELSGTWAGTVAALGSMDGVTYDIPLSVRSFGTGSVSASSVSANGAYFVEAAGLHGVQLSFTRTSGSLVIAGVSTKLLKSIRIHAPQTDPAWVATVPAGVGALLQVPAATANGTPLTNAGAMPTNAKGVLLSIPPGGEIDLAIAAAQPGAPPFSMPYPNPTPVTLDVFVELNGVLGFVTVNTPGMVGGSSKACGLRWI